MKHFRWSIIVTLAGLGLAFWWGSQHGFGGQTGMAAGFSALFIASVLGVLEVSLSFDNAVVNAGVLKDMDEYWRKLFLTVGIIIAVFGMRLVFPIVIVAATASMGMIDVINMALNNPKEYSAKLIEHHASIAAFGGIFLLLVFLNFVFDDDKDTHWLGAFEAKLGRLGKLDAISVGVALLVLFGLRYFVPEAEQVSVLVAGIAGIALYIGVDGLGALFEDEDAGEAAVETVKRSGLASFIYLEVLDASFSFDGVIGAFAITNDVVIIMLGLAIGAMFVRSMTIFLVDKGTLDQYIFLEHGAHYAIGVLGLIMLAGAAGAHVPEVVTGLIGVAFIVVSVLHSISYQKKHPA
jgi:hypothetical protein